MVAEGGYDEVTAQKKWSEIGRTVCNSGWCFVIRLAINFTLQLKFQMQSTPAQLKFHYEKVLYPYEVFLAKRDKIKVQQQMVTSCHWILCLCNRLYQRRKELFHVNKQWLHHLLITH